MWSRKDTTQETHELSVSEKTAKRNVSVKSPYFTSVARNSNLTNKPEADAVLTYSIQTGAEFVVAS